LSFEILYSEIGGF